MDPPARNANTSARMVRTVAAAGKRALSAVLPALCVAACAGDPGYGPATVESYRPAPLVVVTIDTLRADRLGCYGYFRDTSPYIDRFSREAVLYESAITLMPTTLPAHTALWTSMYPLQTGVLDNSKTVQTSDTGVRFFAEMMRDAGYTTAGFVSASPVKSRTGINTGFEHYDEPARGGPQRRADITTDRVLDWLDSAPTEPFFLWVHYFDPHNPYDPPAPYDGMFTADGELDTYLQARGFPSPGDPEVRRMNDLYDGEVRFTDSQIERLLEGLRAHGWYDDATIVLTSDHGEGLGQHGWKGHGRIWNEQLFVPLMIKYPAGSGIRPGRRPYLVSLIDVLPTLVASLKLPLATTDSAQMVGDAVLSGPSNRDWTFVQRTPKERRRLWGTGQKFGLVSADWKYHHATDSVDEFYDMRADPDELENLIDVRVSTAELLQHQLLEGIETVSSSGVGLDGLEEISPEAIRELRALGYIQ